MDPRKVLLLSPLKEENSLCDSLVAGGWEVHSAHDFKSASNILHRHHFAAGLVVIGDAIDKEIIDIEDFLHSHHSTEWVALVKPEALLSETVRKLVINTCHDYHTLPVDAPRLLHSLGHAYGKASLRRQLAAAEIAHDERMLGKSPVMHKLFGQIAKIAASDAAVLISGESGTGKELTAHSIHQRSQRATSRFVAVNCAALPPTLIYSELFGYEKGAFTGANQTRKGFIEAAAGGTIFLDEIGDLPLDLQTTLLRFLQEKTIHRLGSAVHLKVDVRVMAATNRDLLEEVRKGKFRQDLYFRLAVLNLHVPPLRERESDITLLAEHFLRKFARDNNTRVKGYSQRALQAMQCHFWKGNVRELANHVRNAVILCENSLITPANLGLERRTAERALQPLEQARTTAEKNAIQVSLLQTGRNITRAARELGVSRVTLYRLIEKHQIPI